MRALFFITSLLSTFCLLAQDKVSLSINPGTAEVGETFEISVKSSKVGTIDFSHMPDEFLQDYAIQQGSSQHKGTNGKTVVQYYYTISGIIKKAGNYTFGPVTLTHGSKTFVSNTATINVSPKVKMKGGHITSRQLRDPAFGIIEVNKISLYEGEPLLVRAKIYARYKPTHVNSYQAYEMDGALIKHPIGNNQQLKMSIEQLNGESLYAIDYDKNILFPAAVGKVKIDPYKLNLHQGYQNFPLESGEITVNIKPLPANPPKDFVGAVGTFAVSREIPETRFNQGDVIKMIVTISGIGNLHNITEPQLNLPKGYTIYGDPVISEHISIGVRGAEGKISYEYNIEVAASGITALPPTHITYFDPDQDRYITTETTEDSLNIKEIAGMVVDNTDDGSDKRTNEIIVQEFNPRENNGNIAQGKIYGSIAFWGGVTLPLASAFFFLFFVKSRENVEERKVEKQRKNAQSAALSTQLQAVRIAAKGNDNGDFYDALDKALRGTYAAHMKRQDEVVSKQEILSHAGAVDADLKVKTAALFSNIEIAKFSFGSDTNKRNEDLQTLEAIITNLKSK
jgi:hypothetical protein